MNKRKSLYHQLAEEFNRGQIIPYVARNIGCWKAKSNTLSVLDITLISPVAGARMQKKLRDAFNKQILEMGYGRQVVTLLSLTICLLFINVCS